MSPEALVVDSSIWIEILNRGPLAKVCSKEIKSAQTVYVPTLVLYEVYKKLALLHSEDQALSAIATISQYEVTDLSREIALTAGDISIQKSLPMADSIVLAHAQLRGAILLTLDNDFSGIPGTRVLRSKHS